MIETNTCIDYFKFKVLLDFQRYQAIGSFERSFILDLFHHLRVNEESITFKGGTTQYKARYILDSEIVILSQPTDFTKRNDEREYFIVEMTGSACRNFEKRGGSWFELFKYYLDHFTYFEGHRIDTAIDDFCFMRMEEILKFVKNGCYSGKFRGCYLPTEDIDDFVRSVKSDDETPYDRKIIEKLKRDNTLKGLSITWGSKSAKSIQFQIYDKKLERIAHDKEVEVDSWVRFEMRFMKEHCDDVVKSLFDGMVKDNNVAKTIKGLISDRFELKAKTFVHDPQRVPMWKKWKDFLGSVDKIPANRVSQYDVENSVTRAKRYLNKYLGTVLTKLYLGVGSMEEFFKMIAEVIVDTSNKDDKFNEALIAGINYYRLENYKDKVDFDNAVSLIKDLKDKYHIDDEDEEKDFYFVDEKDLPF